MINPTKTFANVKDCVYFTMGTRDMMDFVNEIHKIPPHTTLMYYEHCTLLSGICSNNRLTDVNIIANIAEKEH